MIINKGYPYIMMINDNGVDKDKYYYEKNNNYEELISNKDNGKIIPISLTDFYKKYFNTIDINETEKRIEELKKKI